MNRLTMREILFRGKRTDNGEWVEGYFFADTGTCSLKAEGKCFCAHDGSYATIRCWNDDFHEYDEFEVDPATVGEYTGLVDKNGKRIFEGDILRLIDKYSGADWMATVMFGNPHCRYTWGWELVPIGEPGGNTDILCWVEMEDSGALCEIIGNIYDTTELGEGAIT